jgi:hypothetical protein
MGYAELFDYHVLPIVRAWRDSEGNFELGDWVGTGFTFGEGTLVTCWHCVGANLPDGEVYIAVGRSEGKEQQSRELPLELEDLGQDANRTDLALARIGCRFEPRLRLATEPLEWGDDVVAFGFPLTTDSRNPDTHEKHIQTEARVFKGYVTRNFRDRYQRDQLAVELSMPAPIGMSGAPLFKVQQREDEPFECYGVVYAEYMSKAKDGPDLWFGAAVRLDALRDAKAAATDNLPLAAYLSRDLT